MQFFLPKVSQTEAMYHVRKSPFSYKNIAGFLPQSVLQESNENLASWQESGMNLFNRLKSRS